MAFCLMRPIKERSGVKAQANWCGSFDVDIIGTTPTPATGILSFSLTSFPAVKVQSQTNTSNGKPCHYFTDVLKYSGAL
jgi:hypothetical protein